MNGYDEERGKFLVPFDLKRDVIDPLGRVEDGLAELNRGLNEHLEQVRTQTKARMEPLAVYVEKMIEHDKVAEARRQKLMTIFKWGVGPMGAVVLALVGRAFGFTY